MIEGLKPYPETRDTGLPWLGATPKKWEVHRAKYSFREVDDRSEAGGEELLSVSHKTGVTPRSQKNITMFMAESYEGHKVCRPGDIVVNTMWAWMAAIGVSRHIGIVSPAYGIYRPRTPDRFEPKYLDYLLRTEIYRAEYLRSSRGITTSRLRLYPPDFLNIPFVQPPLDEQRLIVRLLDWHGAQTAKLIRAKKKIIALLNEQKQAIIHRAVTRGLDPNVRHKPSGIPWLGDVPEGWEVKRLRRLATKFGSGVTPKGGASSYTTDGVIFLRSQNIHFDGLRLQDVARIPRATHEAMKGTHVRACDVLLNITGASIGRACAVPVAFADNANVNQHVCIIRVKRDELVPEFLAATISTPVMQREIRFEQNGASREGLTLDAIKSFSIPLPPLTEQQQILESIKLDALQWDVAALGFEREIALIQEFRTRLIANVVTGKLDVRALAASLRETVELELIDDLVEGDALDEAVDDAENEEVAA